MSVFWKNLENNFIHKLTSIIENLEFYPALIVQEEMRVFRVKYLALYVWNTKFKCSTDNLEIKYFYIASYDT
jgi:hypothetical protein